MTVALLDDHDFKKIQSWLLRKRGVHLPATKKTWVAARLFRRLKYYRFTCYGDYLRMLRSAEYDEESQLALDLLSNRDTCFFREYQQFVFLREKILPGVNPRQVVRVWSAACSTGEESFSLAMTLAEGLLGLPWEIIGSDISTHALTIAREGCYSLTHARTIPKEIMAGHCEMRGGDFRVDPDLCKRVNFMRIDLTAPLPDIGEFDVIFLRNVMMHFDQETKRQVVSQMLRVLKPGGYFVISSSESLRGITAELQLVATSIYKKH